MQSGTNDNVEIGLDLKTGNFVGRPLSRARLNGDWDQRKFSWSISACQ